MDFALIDGALRRLRDLFLSPGSDISFASLIAALLIALAFHGARRHRRRGHVSIRAMLRAFFPRAFLFGPSTRADIKYFFINTFLAGLLLGWAILSYHVVGKTTLKLLVDAFGPLSPTTLPAWITATLMTIALFVAYELGYFTDHYLSHKVPFLWEFHKVHHSAEHLTPLTNFRVHPVDGLVFVNIMALMMGLTEGALSFLFGKTVQQFTISQSNAIIVVFTYLVAHLHHTSIWIPFTGIWGRLFVSPAHHQIHHSTNPIHFDKNMGSCLAIFDWMFGTLHIPSSVREKITYGTGDGEPDPHDVAQGLVRPVMRAFGHLVPAHMSDRPTAAQTVSER